MSNRAPMAASRYIIYSLYVFSNLFLHHRIPILLPLDLKALVGHWIDDTFPKDPGISNQSILKRFPTFPSLAFHYLVSMQNVSILIFL